MTNLAAADAPVLWEYQDVATYLRVAERTVRKWTADGTGPPPVRFGRRVRFRLCDVTAWLDEKATAA